MYLNLHRRKHDDMHPDLDADHPHSEKENSGQTGSVSKRRRVGTKLSVVQSIIHDAVAKQEEQLQDARERQDALTDALKGVAAGLRDIKDDRERERAAMAAQLEAQHQNTLEMIKAFKNW